MEALYQARDSAWQAVCEARHSDISEADRASYEHVALEVVSALEALGTTCALTSSPGCRAEPDQQAWLSHVFEGLRLNDADHTR